MVSPTNDDFTFISVTTVRRDLIHLLAEPDDESSPGVLFGYEVQSNGGMQDDLAFGPIRTVSYSGREFIVLGVEGEWSGARLSRGKWVPISGHLDPGPTGPGRFGWIRDARDVAGTIYAVGMSRQAYVRGDKDVWHHIDADILAKPEETVGFNGVDGFSGEELYAAGLDGEIWRYNGKRWFSVPSPTNVQLSSVRCIGDQVYIVGAAGIVLRGRMDRFEVVAKEREAENLESVEGFGDDIYVASLRGLYRLKDKALAEVKTKLRGDFTAGSLSAKDGILWSAGAKHLLWTDDGKKWTQVSF
jgi:hypothetical protein